MELAISSAFVVFLFLFLLFWIKQHREYKKLLKDIEKNRQDNQVVFFKDDSDLTWEWSEMPHYGSN